MKRFLKRTGLFLLLLVAATIMTLFVIPSNPESIFLSYKNKCERLDSIKSPRIILIGGSNLALGIDSKMIEDSLKMPVVNCGIHMGVGMKYMMDDAMQYVRNSDILVVVPEYDHFYGEQAYGGGCLTSLLIQGRPKNLLLLNKPQVVKAFQGILSVGRSNMEYLWNVKIRGEQTDTIYSLSAFNEQGDLCKHWTNYESRCKEKVTTDSLTHFNRNFADYFAHQYRRMEKTTNVVLVPPVIRRSAFIAYRKQIAETEKYLNDKHIYFYVSPSLHALPDSMGYDSKYHQNGKGVKRFTQLLIKELKHKKSRMKQHTAQVPSF